MSRPQAAERLTMRMKPLISSARDLFSSSRVRALRDKDNYLVIDNTQTHTHTHTDRHTAGPTWPSRAWSCRRATERWGWPGLWWAPTGVWLDRDNNHIWCCRAETLGNVRFGPGPRSDPIPTHYITLSNKSIVLVSGWICCALVLGGSAHTWWRPPWWTCIPPPWRCPSGTCLGKAGNAPEGNSR